ncbi:hypothetical protein L6R49_13805 [Myxococcota bacterium]|nr:hypothetical protein [Myxococcota bacterium]
MTRTLLLLALLPALAFARDVSPGEYTLSVSPVAELCLDGVGPLEPWAELSALGLRPVEVDGQARLSLCVTRARFAGRRFSEAVFAVAVDGPQGPGLYLVAAHNSVPSFARVERRRNLSPYTHGQIAFSDDPALAALLLRSADGAEALRATNGGPPLSPQPSAGFEGPIYLPSGGHFFAQLSPASGSAPFVPDEDTLTLLPGSGQSAVAAAVAEAGFTPTGWRGSQASTHTKTRTAPPSRPPHTAP